MYKEINHQKVAQENVQNMRGYKYGQQRGISVRLPSFSAEQSFRMHVFSKLDCGWNVFEYGVGAPNLVIEVAKSEILFLDVRTSECSIILRLAPRSFSEERSI